MSTIRLLTDGQWNKSPVLTAARKLLVVGLAQHCESTALGRMADFANGTSYDVDKLTIGGTPIIRISNITDPKSNYITTNEIFDARFIVNPGELLVSWSASFKTIIWPGPVGVRNQHIFSVTEKNGYSRRFLRHLIEAVFDEMQRQVVGMGMMHLRRSAFLKHVVPNPDFQVQEAVANYLDWIEEDKKGWEPILPPFLQYQRRIITRIEELAAKIEAARGLRREAMKRADALISSGISQIVSELAVRGSLEAVLVEKPRNGWSARCDNLDTGIPVLTLSAVTGFKYRADAFKRTSEATRADAHYWLKEGDMLITRSNTPELVGHVAIYNGSPKPCIYPDLMMKLALNEKKARKEFVHIWMQSQGIRDYIRRSAKGTSPTMKKISQRMVLDIPFPETLSLSEQDRIVRQVQSLQTKVEAMRQCQIAAASELDALLPAVLDKAFRDDL